MAEFEKVAKVSDIQPGEIKSFVLGNEMVAICNTDGKFYAFIDECSHQTLPLSDGLLEGKTITCAYHGAEFNVETGEALCLPAVDGIETYEVKIEGDDIYILLPD
ncbi:MAG: benzene 1,2-dioxygenase [Thermodesulfobacteriota bacterium]|nr:MAG: benzene 1,2-dioxygenase [Thermodesulfobacteriota bacterium]